MAAARREGTRERPYWSSQELHYFKAVALFQMAGVDSQDEKPEEAKQQIEK